MSQRPRRRLRNRIASALGTENAILIGDDDQLLLEQLSTSLQADGKIVFTASSGAAALVPALRPVMRRFQAC